MARPFLRWPDVRSRAGKVEVSAHCIPPVGFALSADGGRRVGRSASFAVDAMDLPEPIMALLLLPELGGLVPKQTPCWDSRSGVGRDLRLLTPLIFELLGHSHLKTVEAAHNVISPWLAQH